MKKIILFLFAVAASSSLLLAQTEEPTTNSQLPTPNCNNQGDYPDCYLMMIPGELKEIEEGIEDIKEIFRSSEKKVCLPDSSINTPTENPLLFSNSSIVLSSAINNGKNHAEENEKMTIFEGNEIDSKEIDENQKVYESFSKIDPWTRKLVLAEQKRKIYKAQENVRTTVGESLFCWKKAVNSLQKSVEYWEKASEVQEALVVEYCLVAEQSNQAAKQWIKAVKIMEQGKVNQWREAGESMQLSVDCRIKRIQARSIGDEKKAQEYLEVAEEFQKASDSWVQVVKLLMDGKKHEAIIFARKGYSLQSEGMGKKYALQVLDAQEEGKVTLAAAYSEAAATSQCATDQLKLSAQVYSAVEKDEGKSWYWAGRSLQVKADYKAKAGEAQEEGKVILAAAYSEAAATSQCATDQLKLSAQAYSSGKMGEGDALYQAGRSLQAKADYQAKAVEAQEEGKATLAVGYSEAMVTSQYATDQLKLSAQAYSSGKMGEGDALHRAGRSLQEKADYEAKTIEAREEDRVAFVASYSEAAVTSQNLANQFFLAAKTMAAGKHDESNEQLRSATSLQLKLNYQVKAIEAQEAEKTMLATGYNEAAGMLQRAADQYRLSAQAMAVEKKRESISRGLDWVAYSFHVSGCYHAQACEALENGKTALAASYSEASATSQYTADQFSLAVEAIIAGKQDEANKRLGRAESLYSKVDYQIKAIKAQEAGKVMLAAGYREAAETSLRAADQFELSVQALFSEKRRESISWSNHSACLQAKADYQAKACEAQENGKAVLTAGYNRAAATLERAAESYKKAAEARALGKWLTAHGFDKLGEKINREAHAKATRAEEAAKGGMSKFVSRIRSFVDFLGSVESDV